MRAAVQLQRSFLSSASASIRRCVVSFPSETGFATDAQVIYRASQAAGPMAGWVKANLAYTSVLDKVSLPPCKHALVTRPLPLHRCSVGRVCYA